MPQLREPWVPIFRSTRVEHKGQIRGMANNAKVSILMLTYNAPEYVEISIRSLVEKTAAVNYELVVVDNASEPETRKLVGDLHEKGWVSQLRLMDYNSLFAEGNNIAAALAAEDATHFLLLNSDVEVKNPRWLEQLLKVVRHQAAGGDPECRIFRAGVPPTRTVPASLRWQERQRVQVSARDERHAPRSAAVVQRQEAQRARRRAASPGAARVGRAAQAAQKGSKSAGSNDLTRPRLPEGTRRLRSR
jgi:hypothetical protein